VTEAVEQLDLLSRVVPDVVVLREVVHELVQARAKLIREVRRRRPNQRVDVVAGWLAHGAERYR
jgi:hypothetical protein